MAGPSYIPSFYFSKFAQGISEPFTALSAYQAGAIDENGNFLKPESSIDPLEYLIIKLKRIFAELPMGMTKAKLGNYMSTMQLFGEEAKEFGITDSEFIGLVEANLLLNGHTVSYIELCEDMGAAGMASAATSPGYNTGSISGYDPVMGTTRRDTPVLQGMDNCEMFDVCPEEMRGFKDAKAWKHVPDSETKRYLQRYQRRNPKGHMALRSMNPDTGESDLYWIKFKPLSFMEEYHLNDFDFLTEEKKSNKEREHMIYNAFSNLLNLKGFKRNTDARKREDLKLGEYAVFHPSNEKTDIIVHHDLSGTPGFSHTETKYQRHVPGRSSTTYDVVIPHSKLEMVSPSGKPHLLNPSKIIKHFGSFGKSQVRKFLRRSSDLVKEHIPSILKAKGGMMIVGNDKNVHVTHNSDNESIKKHDSALLKHLGLSSTHTADDLSKSGHPYLGNIGRAGGGEHVKIRVSAPRHVERNGKKIDTLEMQQQNAQVLQIPSLENINPE